VGGIQGSLHVTLEEGTHSAWLYDLLVQRVKKLISRKTTSVAFQMKPAIEGISPSL
jgi:hypothetical protein